MIDNSSYAISRSVIVRAKEDKKKFKKSKNKKVGYFSYLFCNDNFDNLLSSRDIINFTHRETNENIRKIRRKIVREYSKYLR